MESVTISPCAKRSAIKGSIRLKNTTSVDKLIEAAPKIPGSIPNFGLPRWKKMSLDTKIPMIPGPPGAYNFTRQKLGKKLWIGTKDAAFNINDPYNYEMKMDKYDMMHDRHLAICLSSPTNIKRLKERGMITDEMDAKCTLRDYNMYRKYLRRLQCDSISKELNKKIEVVNERRMLQMSEVLAQKELEKLKKKEIRDQHKDRMKKEEEEIKLQKIKEQKENFQKKLVAYETKRREDNRKRKEKSKAKTEFIKTKLNMAAKISRKKVIKTVLDWKKKEYEHKKAAEQRLAKEQEEKWQLLCEKWERRQQFQKEAIEREEYFLNCAKERRAEAIKKYNERIARSRKQLQYLLAKVKEDLSKSKGKSCKCSCDTCECDHKARNSLSDH